MSRELGKDAVAIRECDICGREFEVNSLTIFDFMCASCNQTFDKALAENDAATLMRLYRQHLDNKA